uniref:General transcription factor IIH subunit 4 n=1 Tax=Strongyloides stercoralis TaxID=6248 RepID=A0A0K0DSA7_STRER
MGDLLSDRPLLRYLIKLTDDELLRYYKSIPICLVVYRMLPKLSQNIVTKLLWLPLHNWKRSFKKDYLKLLVPHLILLFRLRIINDPEQKQLSLNHDFKENYLTGIMLEPKDIVNLRTAELSEKKAKKIAGKDLGEKANERWECILTYLALPSPESAKKVSIGTKTLFQETGFVRDRGNLETEITSQGFQFLLLNRVEQLWTYILQYFDFKKQSGEDNFYCFEFLLKLTLLVNFNNEGSKDLNRAGMFQTENTNKDIDDEDRDGGNQGSTKSSSNTNINLQLKAYNIGDDWDEELQNFFVHLRELGLVFLRKRKDGFFFLTPLMNNLAVSSTSIENMQEANKNSGFIIAESNYRVYAYSDNDLQLAILSTFTDMLYRFDDLAVGVLTRDSVRKALSVGITAKQIITFLRSNSKIDCIEKNGPIFCVPITISDQITLWEQERQRIETEPAIFMEHFDSESQFRALLKFTKENDLLLWCNESTKEIIAKESEKERIGHFLRSLRR